MAMAGSAQWNGDLHDNKTVGLARGSGDNDELGKDARANKKSRTQIVGALGDYRC